MDEGGAVAADHGVDSYYGDYDNEKMRQVCVGEALQATTWYQCPSYIYQKLQRYKQHVRHKLVHLIDSLKYLSK